MDVTNTQERILIVDDEKGVRDVISKRLESWGYEVLMARNGEEGLKIVEEHLPDLVLLDIMMPKLKGLDVCAMLKANPKTRHIPIIFLSALSMAEHVQIGMNFGAEDYIVKPYDADELRKRIKICLMRHNNPDERPNT